MDAAVHGVSSEASEPTNFPRDDSIEVAVSVHPDEHTQGPEQPDSQSAQASHETTNKPEHEVEQPEKLDSAGNAEVVSSLLIEYKEMLMKVAKEQSELTFSKSLKLLEGADPVVLSTRKTELKGVFNEVLESMIAHPTADEPDIPSDDSGSQHVQLSE